MFYSESDRTIKIIIENQLSHEVKDWLHLKLKKCNEQPSQRELYLTYSLIASKVPAFTIDFKNPEKDTLEVYLKQQNANLPELTRIHFLTELLKNNSDFYTPLVKNIIQVADKTELATFLKFLLLLPEPGNYKEVAVDALRTNITSVFDAIALDNPYPSVYFTKEQWNQLFLKAAFMERDLRRIVHIDKMANPELSRIISDYAHERWKASRTVNPYFWRPVTSFMDTVILEDMKNLFESSNPIENKAATLCCYHSGDGKAKQLLLTHATWVNAVENGTLTWNTLTNKV
ncbi:EboA domain-containing protein [Aquimarina sp. ERC-38]|uniref:EboA domain-containing protein n=1 Tax=Aquimarina sp. ERC-38 TaxID=2949996 RepID=UPI0022460685|nr:EboA domain-containing protein [Aquimarina sp. ERC-38]UZO80579.1 EboA domain-containing protein [Aquimarina sp. ERC-38]